MTAAFTLNWGVIATGNVAEGRNTRFHSHGQTSLIRYSFCKDLLTNPECREVYDIKHRLAGVASRNIEKARNFLRRIDAPDYSVAYGSYTDLVSDANVDIVYIATPHSHHFQNILLALKAGKHVLCEKPFTVTAEQTRFVVNLAREKSLFLMEAVWTRFQPLTKEICSLVAEGEIGTITRVVADLSFNNISESDENLLVFPDSHRKVNPELADGTILTLGIYPLTWIVMILYHLQGKSNKEQPLVMAAGNRYHTGIDDDIVLILNFQRLRALGIATSSFQVATAASTTEDTNAILIQGSRGEIRIAHPAFQPMSFTLLKGGSLKTFEYSNPKDKERNNWGHGFYWEADEVARCIRAGKTESDGMPLDESILMMETIEEALRQVGVTYPDTNTSIVDV